MMHIKIRPNMNIKARMIFFILKKSNFNMTLIIK